MNNLLIKSIVLFFLSVIFINLDAEITFPGDLKCSVSPNKKYEVINYNCDTCDTAHWIVFQKVNDNIITLKYGKNISILWSKTGNKLLVNDNSGNNNSKCYILSFRDSILDITEEIFNIPEIATLIKEKFNHLQYDHLHINGIKWLSDDEIEFKIWGQGEGEIEEIFFNCKIVKKKIVLLKILKSKLIK
jgi:hypothetical protein